MDLAIFFENQERIANSLERIADILEARGTVATTAGHTGEHASPAQVVKKRRTKAEIEAEKNAQQLSAAGGETPVLVGQQPAVPPVAAQPAAATNVVVAATGQPAAEQPNVAVAGVAGPIAVPTPQVAAPVAAAPVAAAPVAAAPVAAAPVVAAPVVAAPAASPTVQGHGPEYMGFAVEHQFKELNTLVGPYLQYPHVADTVKAVIAQQGIGMPISNPADRSLPADNYAGLTNEQRYHIYYATLTAIQQFVSANTAQAGI